MGKPEIVRDGVRVFYLHEGYPNQSGVPFATAVAEKFKILHREKPFHLVHSFDRSAYLVGRRKKSLDVSVAYDVEATQMSQLFSIVGMTRESVGSVIKTGVSVAFKFASTFLGRDRELLATADGMFVTSPQQRLFLERYYLYPDRRIYTVPYGVELATAAPPPEGTSLRQKFGITEHAHVVVTVTDMAVPEELFILLRAFETVAIKKPNSHLVVVGTGEHWKKIELEMLNLALGSKVIMTGAIKDEDVSNWISISDVYVNMSSRSTGFEPTMIEAMSKKKVIIGSELSPLANIIDDGQEGFLLRPADISSLAHLLVELFSGSLPTLQIGQKAQEKVNNLFEPQKMIGSLTDAYYQILENGR